MQGSLDLKQHEIDEKIQKLKEEEEAHRKRLDENEEIIALRKKYEGLVHELDKMVAAGDFNVDKARPASLVSGSESFEDFKKRRIVEKELHEARRARIRHNKDTMKTGRQSDSSLEALSSKKATGKKAKNDDFGSHKIKGDPHSAPANENGSDNESIEEEEEEVDEDDETEDEEEDTFDSNAAPRRV